MFIRIAEFPFTACARNKLNNIDLSSPDNPIEDAIRFENFVKTQWNYIYYSMSFTIILYSLQFPLWYSTFKRNELRTNGSLGEGEFVMLKGTDK